MKEPVDPRSTQRKRARKVLFREKRPFICRKCGRSPKEIPPDAPQDLEVNLDPPNVSRLEANHINKDIMDNDPVNLEWLCPSDHKKEDSLTEKGESRFDDEFGYGSSLFGL